MDSSDDKTGRDGLQKESLNKLAKSWIVNPETCTMPDDSSASSAGCQVMRVKVYFDLVRIQTSTPLWELNF